MDQPAEFLLPILPFLVQVFPTPGKETIAWGAGKGWSAANIGSGVNFASNTPGCAGSICTGMVLGTKPLRVKVTVNGPSAESSIEHGVRQREPSDAVASAPCGLEFKWMVALTDLRSGAAGISPDDWRSGATSSTTVDLGDLGSDAA